MAHITRVAVVGATGSVGSFIIKALVAAGKHKVTAITRTDSTAVIPEGVQVAKVDYNKPATLVDALRGQEALVITMSPRAPRDQQSKLIDAAAEAGVPWVIPNEWGNEKENQSVAEETMLAAPSAAARARIEERGVSSWIGVICNFWYEFSLGGGVNHYGFDFANRSAVFYGDGTVRVNTTTWPQVGRAVANLLALKTVPEGPDDKSPTLSGFRNKFVYISSFTVSQQDMLDSVLRVTGAKAEDWTVTHEDPHERWADAKKMFAEGNRLGFLRAMYTRIFYPDGSGAYERTHGLDNEVLGLPQEDLDTFTKIAIERAGTSY
ncbi:CipA protein [Xylariales sp. PMI_506]|nr:CipA protein [Xylariales sp. PMI_506]